MSLRVLKTALRKPEPEILANFILMSVQMSEICIKKGKKNMVHKIGFGEQLRSNLKLSENPNFQLFSFYQPGQESEPIVFFSRAD